MAQIASHAYTIITTPRPNSFLCSAGKQGMAETRLCTCTLFLCIIMSSDPDIILFVHVHILNTSHPQINTYLICMQYFHMCTY